MDSSGCSHQAAWEALLAGRPLDALRIVGPMLEDNPSDLVAWRIGALSVLEIGDRGSAIKNLRSAAMALSTEGNPIQAIAGIKELEELGVDCADLHEKVAALYCDGSARIREADMPPPPLPVGRAASPWGDDFDEARVVARAGDAMAMAWGAAMTLDGRTGDLPHIPLLSSLGPSDFVELVASLRRVVVEPGEVVVEQGESGDAMYIVAEGSVAVSHLSGKGQARELARLGAGAFFGEMAMVSSAPRAAQVKAIERTVLLSAQKEEMERLAKRAPATSDVLIAFCHARMLENLMRVSPVLAPVPARSRPEVIARFHTDFRETGEKIIEEGVDGKGLYLVVSGQVSVIRREDGEELRLASLGAGDLFGEISLLMRKPATASVVADRNTALLFLPREEFETVTSEFPQLLKGAYDIAVARENQNVSIMGKAAQDASDLVLV